MEPDESEPLASFLQAKAAVKAKRDKLEAELSELRSSSLEARAGPIAAGLDEKLKKHKIHMQAYHGRSFVGNHCHKYLKQVVFEDVRDSVVTNTVRSIDDVRVHDKAQMIALKFKVINRVYSRVHLLLSHKSPVERGSLSEVQECIGEYMRMYWMLFPKVPVSPKQHILEHHCVDFIGRWGVGLGLLGEQGGEETHAVVNILKSRTNGLIMKEHRNLVSPDLWSALPVPPFSNDL
jgi:hypothetical protein